MGILETIKNELNNFTWVNRYKEYLSLREKGLKKAAQTEIEKFILDFYRQNKSDRRNFIDLIYRIGKEANDYTLYVPYNLSNQVIALELEDWRKDEPQNPIPFRWSLDFHLLQKSIEIDPVDQTTLELFFTLLCNRISMNQHEIEFGYPYDGNADDDYALINKYEGYVENISDLHKREKIKESLAEIKKVALQNIRK